MANRTFDHRTFDLGRILAFDYGEEMPTDPGVKFFVKTNGVPSVLYGAPIEVKESRKLEEKDLDQMLYVESDNDITITIPTDEAVLFPVGAEIEIYRAGAGAVTVAADDGVTIQCYVPGRSVYGQYASVFLKKAKANTWILQGMIG